MLVGERVRGWVGRLVGWNWLVLFGLVGVMLLSVSDSMSYWCFCFYLCLSRAGGVDEAVNSSTAAQRVPQSVADSA